MTSPAYTIGQQLTGGGGSWGVPRWAVPAAPTPVLPRDRSVVTESRPVVWPQSMQGVSVSFGGAVPWMGSLAGLPINVATRDTPWREVTTHAPEWFMPSRRRVQVPADPWIEGHPRVPVFPWDYGPGQWDRHCIIVGPDKIVEMIGFDPRHNTCMGYAEISLDGTTLLPGSDGWACAGQVCMSKYTLTSLTDQHVVGLAIPDYAGADGSLPPGTFPHIGDRLRLATIPLAASKLGGHAFAVAKALNTHGCVVVDRNAGSTATLLVQPGAHLARSNLPQLRIPLTSFELAA